MPLSRSDFTIAVKSAARAGVTSHESVIESFPRSKGLCDRIGFERPGILHARNGLHRRRACEGRKD